MTDLTVEQLPKGWRYHIGPLEVLFDFMSATARGVEAWIEVRHDGSDVPEIFGRKDLTGANTVRDLANAWKGQNGLSEDLFRDIMRRVVYDVIQRWRAGPDPTDLFDAELASDRRYLLRPWVEIAAPTRLIAQGGSTKSAFGLALALTVCTGSNKILHGYRPTQTGPVAFLDWEAHAGIHKERLDAIARGAGIKIDREMVHYFDMRRHGALRRTATALANRFHELGIVFVVVDSVMLARGSGSEKRAAEDSTLELYEALGELGCAALLIDHKPKDAIKSRDKKGGYGSVVMDNSARLVWDMHQVAKLSDGRIRWTASNTKANNSAPHPDVSYEVQITADRRSDLWHTCTFTPIASISDGLVESSNLAEQIELLMVEHGPMTVPQIAELLERGEGTIRKVLNRGAETGKFRKLPDTVPPLWILAIDDPREELEAPW